MSNAVFLKRDFAQEKITNGFKGKSEKPRWRHKTAAPWRHD